ncbi:MAG: pilus assembly protein [Gracilibacteraceae bacterium]|nr:pilus assembly protein [Gracilibacteraceae bacterium]
MWRWWFLDKHKSENGSYTVEAVMVFVIIMFAVLALLFSFLYMQQKTSLESIASFAAQQGAEIWPDSRRNIVDELMISSITYEGYFEKASSGDGKSEMVLRMDVGNDLSGQKAALIGEALSKRIESTILNPESTRVKITFNNNFLRRSIIIELNQEIKVPLGGLKEFFDGKDTLVLSARSAATVTEPDEFIRNADLMAELSKKFGEKIDLKDLADRISSKQ